MSDELLMRAVRDGEVAQLAYLFEPYCGGGPRPKQADPREGGDPHDPDDQEPWPTARGAMISRWLA